MPFAYANRSTCPKRRKNGLSGHFQGFDNSVAHVYPSRRLLMFDGFRRHHLRRRHAHPGICVNPRPAGIAGIGAMIVSITINAHRCRPQTAFVAQFTTGVRATVRHIPETGVQSETNADATMRSHVRESKPSLTGSTGTEQPRRPGRGPRSGTAPEKFRPYPSSTPLLGALLAPLRSGQTRAPATALASIAIACPRLHRRRSPRRLTSSPIPSISPSSRTPPAKPANSSNRSPTPSSSPKTRASSKPTNASSRSSRISKPSASRNISTPRA